MDYFDGWEYDTEPNIIMGNKKESNYNLDIKIRTSIPDEHNNQRHFQNKEYFSNVTDP
jgi:hypothetical protein